MEYSLQCVQQFAKQHLESVATHNKLFDALPLDIWRSSYSFCVRPHSPHKQLCVVQFYCFNFCSNLHQYIFIHNLNTTWSIQLWKNIYCKPLSLLSHPHTQPLGIDFGRRPQISLLFICYVSGFFLPLSSLASSFSTA